jgi:hypothetical protein
MLLQTGPPYLNKVDGHFLALRWHGRTLEVFSDQLGLRTAYFIHTGRGILFSSRLDWVTRLAGENSIDFTQLGPRWLTFNQFSYESGIKNVQRLGPGGRGTLTPTSIELQSKPWLPEISDDGGERTFRSHISALSNPVLEGGRTVSLGLSGGLDSRALLAVLSRVRPSVVVHTFGDPRDPDIGIAQMIAAGERLSSTLFHDPLPRLDDCISLLSTYASQAHLVEPVTSIIKLRYHERLEGQNKLMMDGGFGELYRRQYLNRLRFKGRTSLRTHNAKRIAPFLRVERANIFSREVNEQMKQGVIVQLQEVLESMPSLSAIGDGNFLDLLSVRTRVPNWGGPEQARLDGIVLNYMPFAQPSLLCRLFSTPLKRRENGRLFRWLILDLCPSLSRYPLAESGTTCPFRMNTIEAWLWTNMKRKIGICFENPLKHNVLMLIKPFVLDTLASSSVRTYEAYDYSGIATIVKGYYAGNAHLAGKVDWWLTFELWRRSLEPT